MTRKIVAFGGRFTDMRAMLAAIAEDPDAIGFTGCVLRQEPDGPRHLRRVNFACSAAEVALAGLMLGDFALDNGEET